MFEYYFSQIARILLTAAVKRRNNNFFSSKQQLLISVSQSRTEINVKKIFFNLPTSIFWIKIFNSNWSLTRHISSSKFFFSNQYYNGPRNSSKLTLAFCIKPHNALEHFATHLYNYWSSYDSIKMVCIFLVQVNSKNILVPVWDDIHRHLK